MAVLFTTYEINPQDTGYVLQHNHNDDGSIDHVLVAANDPGAPASVTNFANIVQRLQNARSSVNANFLALANPNNAQVAAQVQALTKENNALILLLLHALTGIASTAGT